jgi:hypothetical protein
LDDQDNNIFIFLHTFFEIFCINFCRNKLKGINSKKP